MNRSTKTARTPAAIVDRPVFRIPVRPAAVPPDLLALDPATEVVTHEDAAGWSGDRAAKAGNVIELIREVIARQARGFFVPIEVAQILADANGLDAVEILRRMEADFYAGALAVRDRRTLAPHLPGATLRTSYDRVFPADIDAMITGRGVAYRFPPAAEPEHDGKAERPDERSARLCRRHAELKAQGVKDYARRVAAEERITPGRLRQILGKVRPEPAIPTATDPCGRVPKRKR